MGAEFRLYPFSNICEKRILFTPQYFDQPERDLICSRAKEGFVFIDIGANIGGYALAVAAMAAGAKILAVEPHPEIFDRLVYNIAPESRWTVKAIACAIADHNGEVACFSTPRTAASPASRSCRATIRRPRWPRSRRRRC